MKLLLIAVVVLAVAGCGGTTQEERTQNATKTKKVTSDTVKTMTGYTEIQAGRRAQDRARQASAQHQDDLKDVDLDAKSSDQ